MTPEEERELDEFVAALRGETDESSAAARLGKTLRARRSQAMAGRDEAGQMRTWKAIDAKIGAASSQVPSSAWRRMRFAQAAAVFAIGIGAGWFLRPDGAVQPAGSRLEFAYGDFERPRGALNERTVPENAPAESLRALTDALIADSVPFELYSVAAGRRVLFTVPAGDDSRTARVLAKLGIATAAGETMSLTFADTAAR